MSTPPPHRAASKIAQLVGEVIVHHAPWTAQVNAEARRTAVDGWLEGLEGHLAGFVGPFLQQVLDGTDAPEPVRALLAEAISPTAQFSSSIESIFLWGIISSIVSTSVQPFLQGISNDLNEVADSQGIYRPVDLATIATAVGRGLELGATPTVAVPDWAYKQAAQLGVHSDAVDLAASIIGLPPALQELFEMYRRGIIGSDTLGPPPVVTGQTPAVGRDGKPLTVEQGLREGDFRDDWIAAAAQLSHAWLTPLDFVRAAVQSQLGYTDARAWAESTGLDVSTQLPIVTTGTEATPDMFGLAFSIAGRPPGPQELGRMALRGIIPWEGTGADALTFQQGIAESDVKTKWTESLRMLSTYVPPPREVGTLLEHGAIDAATAAKYWEEGGVPADLAAGFVYMTEQEHVGQDKLLAKGQVTTGYFDGIFTNAQATELLGLLGYRDQVAADMLAIVDFRREIQAINSVVRRVGSFYESFKLSATHATQALIDVGISPEQARALLTTWGELRIQPLRVPTTTEIGKAVKYGTLTQAEGLAKLADLGYQPEDAAIVLSSESESPIAPLPPAGTTTTG